MNLNQGVQQVRELLLNPNEQEPTIKLVFGSLLRELQNFHNELANSSVMWTVQEVVLSIVGDQTDYLVPGAGLGRVLFVVSDAAGYPVPVEFTDLADASRYHGYSEMTSAVPGDNLANAVYSRIAFFRQNGSLYVRIPNGFTSSATLTITLATGNWQDNVAITNNPVLPEYHHLAYLRAAMNVLPAARWSGDAGADAAKASQIWQNLDLQAQRVNEQFQFAKRSLAADDVVYIETLDGYF